MLQPGVLQGVPLAGPVPPSRILSIVCYCPVVLSIRESARAHSNAALTAPRNSRVGFQRCPRLPDLSNRHM